MNSYGIMLAKTHENVVAAVVDSGDTLIVFPSVKGMVSMSMAFAGGVCARSSRNRGEFFSPQPKNKSNLRLTQPIVEFT
jgi:hypothetical protein